MRPDGIPLTPGQLRIWFAENFEDAAPAYNVPVSYRLTGPLDEARLRRSLDAVAARHDALHARFGLDDGGEARQWTGPAAPFRLDVRDLSAMGPAEASAEVERAVAEFAWAPFDLERGPLARGLLLRLAPQVHVLALNVHHIVFDDWSTGLLLRDLGAAYRADGGDGPALTPVALPYGRLVRQECERHEELDTEAHLAFWHGRLSGLRPMALPTDRPRAGHRRGAGAAVHFTIPAATAAGLRRLARERRSTPYMVLLTALHSLLARWSGGPDVAVASPVATRSLPGSEDTVCYLVNTLVLRARVEPTTPFGTLLDEVRRTVLLSLSHQDVPFDEVVRTLRPNRTPDGNPLFQVALNYQNAVGSPLDLPGITTVPHLVPRATAKCDLLLDVADDGEAMAAFFEYDSGLFDEDTVRPLAAAFTGWLDQVAAAPDTPAGRLALAPEAGPRLLTPLAPLPVATGEDTRPFPLTASQRLMWLAHQLRPESPEHACPFALEFTGPLDRSALLAALGRVVARHEVLRARVVTERDGEPRWVLGRPPALVPAYADLRAADGTERALRDLLAAELARPFDLEAGPLLRVLLARTGEDRHVLLVNVAHVAFDGQSAEILREEILRLYQAALGLPVEELEPAPSFRRHVLERLRDEPAPDEARLTHWRTYLADTTAPRLPADLRAPEVRTGAGSVHTFALDAGTSAALRALAARARTTPYVLLLAAFQALLSRWTGDATVLVGTPVADRMRVDGDAVVGFHVETLVRRAEFAADPRFDELLGTVHADVIEAHRYTHGRMAGERPGQGCSFDAVVAELQRRGELPGGELFNVLFDVRHTGPGETEAGGLAVRTVELPRLSASTALTVDLDIDAGGLVSGTVEYATELFTPRAAGLFADRFAAVLRQIAADPSVRVGELDLLLPGEPGGARPWPAEGTGARPRYVPVHRQVLDQAARTPQAVALVCGDDQLGYGELAERVERLAHRLIAHGVAAETPVALHLPRGCEMVVAMLAVACAGGAFLTVDPALPLDRKSVLLDDVDARLVITAGPAARSLPERPGLVLVDPAEPAADGDAALRLPEADAEQLAYLIHTSGTTGRPKAVMGLHGPLAAHCEAMAEGYGITADDRVLQFANLSFDAALEQLLPGLTRGATVVLRPDDLWLPEEFGDILRQYGVTVAELPPAYWAAVVSRLPEYGDGPTSGIPPRLRLLILGGDAVSGEVAARWLTAAPGTRLVNTYGPTETTVTATALEVTPAESGPGMVAIGGPRDGIRALVLDPSMRPVPPDTAGELYLGGNGVTRGYLERPGLTADRFVPDPVLPGERLYRSGDLVRLRGDGVLEFLGRADDQVKIRGFRVELGEVSARLLEHPLIELAAVLDHPVPGGDDRLLAAYVVPVGGQSVDPVELHRFCAELLPEYMVPALFVPMPQLPTTSGGKVDRRALPDPFTAGVRGTVHVAPRDELEELVAEVFGTVLGLTGVGAFDDFFHLGGHSLRATQAITRLREAFETDLTLSQFYAARTVAGVAAVLLDSLLDEEGEPAPVGEPAGHAN
ncbi:amino acid adenylation domain-containing protein [Kitasatospora sp. NPDC018058]|uniref:amino acid adenylation domain-containing protein n=1 Tax=Kitasatospora sp. NPDC018058 TaxID=3364025 RepID=UPI0037C06813